MSDPEAIQRTGLYGCEAPRADQTAALERGDVPVAVFGLGKMGLPVAAVFAEVTGNVVGVDVDPAVVEAVEDGRCPVAGEPGLGELVADLVGSGALRATTDGARAAARARLAIVLVPTLIEAGDPDLSAVDAAVDDVAAGLEAGDAVFVESTLPPGTCADRVVPALAASGVDPDAFGVAACPERSASGRALRDVRGAHPRVVGGVDPESTRVAELVYERVVDNDVVAVSDARTAECVKLFEGVYRDVNIGLANELARQADGLGIDVAEAIAAANTQPYCDIHDPGVGVGGHCIPYYPQFLVSSLAAEMPLIEAGRAANERMPRYTATHAVDGLRAEGIAPADAVALVLGLTYRPGVDEVRATPARPLVEALVAAGVEVDAVDPVASTTEPVEAAGAIVRPFADVAALAGSRATTGETESAVAPPPATTGADRDPTGGPDDAPATTADTETADATAEPPREGYDAVVLVTAQSAFQSLDVPALRRRSDRRLVLVDGRREYTQLRDHDSIHYRGIGIDG